MPTNWDEPIVAGVTRVKAAHINEIRSAVNLEVFGNGTPEHPGVPSQYRYSFNWQQAATNSQILAKFVTDLRVAVQLLWDFKSRGSLPDWASGVEPGGPSNPASRNQNPTAVLASDLNDLRVWLDLYIDNHAYRHGINAPTYFPPNGPIISESIASDVRTLTSVPYSLRCNIVGRPDNQEMSDPGDLQHYRTALGYYRTPERDFRIFCVFTLEFYRAPNPGSDPTPWRSTLQGRGTSPPSGDPLASDRFSNSYIREFARRSGDIARYFNSHGLEIDDFIIWNEPNNYGSNDPQNPQSPGFMSAEHFAAILYRSWHEIRSTSFQPNVWWGGIFTVDSDDNGYQYQYIESIYDSISQWQVNGNRPGQSGFQFPWTGCNIHVHRNRSQSDLNGLFSNVWNRCKKLSPSGPVVERIVVGEWGVTQNRPAPPGQTGIPEGGGPLQELFDRLENVDKQRSFEAKIYFQYQRFFEDKTGWWGLQHTDESSGSIELAENDPTDTDVRSVYDARLGAGDDEEEE